MLGGTPQGGGFFPKKRGQNGAKKNKKVPDLIWGGAPPRGAGGGALGFSKNRNVAYLFKKLTML